MDENQYNYLRRMRSGGGSQSEGLNDLSGVCCRGFSPCTLVSSPCSSGFVNNLKASSK